MAKATVCKTVIPGSNPGAASIFFRDLQRFEIFTQKRICHFLAGFDLMGEVGIVSSVLEPR